MNFHVHMKVLVYGKTKGELVPAVTGKRPSKFFCLNS